MHRQRQPACRERQLIAVGGKCVRARCPRDRLLVLDNAGNNQTATDEVKIDTTAPVITPAVSGTLGDNGWYIGDVSVSWTVQDPESGIATSTGCGPTTVSTDTAGLTLTCSASTLPGWQLRFDHHQAGRHGPDRHRQPGTRSRSQWLVQPRRRLPRGRFRRDQRHRRLRPARRRRGPDSATASVSLDCTDNAGNEGTGSKTFQYDDTDPSVTVNLARDPDHNGWYNHGVGYRAVGSDATSDIAGCDPGAVYVYPTRRPPRSRPETDNAGNEGTGSETFQDDDTDPVVAVTGVANGASYTLGSVPSAGCSTSDALSGVKRTQRFSR